MMRARGMLALTLAIWFAEAAFTRGSKEEGRAETCAYKGQTHSCTFRFACWLIGGTSEGGCLTSFPFSNWLFSCCIPPYSSKGVTETVNHLQRRRDSVKRRKTVGCGLPAMGFQKRIIGGSEAFFGELPWQAHLRIAGYQCGGVLVSKFFVLTAAHCVHRAQLRDIMVYLGEYDTQNTGYFPEPYPEEVHRVLQKIVHPNFQFRMSQPDRFDVALVRLSRGVAFRENILPICLPKRGMTFKGKMGIVAGWGKTDTSYGKTGTNVLRKAIVPILSDDECLKWHRHKNIRVELHKEMFCAGHSDGHMDACLINANMKTAALELKQSELTFIFAFSTEYNIIKGDSGGPLIVLEEGRWTLAGITSAGFGCAVDHQPGIYHKVQVTSDWISSVITPPP